MPTTCTLTVGDKTLSVPENTPLLDALGTLGYRITAPCGGEGTCGKCRVQILNDAPHTPTASERALLSAEQLENGMCLACQTRVQTDLEVDVPQASQASEIRVLPDGVGRDVPFTPPIEKCCIALTKQTLSEHYARLEHLRRLGDLRADLRADLDLLRRLPDLLPETGEVTAVMRDSRLIAVEPGDTTETCYGVALDLGTTTVVAALVGLHTGTVVARAASVNLQNELGHDVIARINAVQEAPDNLARLQQLAADSLNAAITGALERSEVDPQHVYEATLVGNATMMHLCLGISPMSLGRMPYIALVEDAVQIRAKDLGLNIHPDAQLSVLPAIAGFVGADTIGAMLAAGFDDDDGRVRLLADIGTNCELALRVGDKLIVTSTPAGPAFEGARISCGMYAEPGAIESITFDDDVSFKVIGNEAPRGLCGSALIDIGAELLRSGILDMTGRILPQEELDGSVSEPLKARILAQETDQNFAIADDIALTQRDVRELQLAKGSIRTAVELLVEKADLTLDDIDELCIAGGFGSYINKENAIRLGLIPALPPEKLRFIGNGALVGARLALISDPMRRIGEQIARQAEHLQVADTPDFQMRFAESMLFT